MCDTFVAPPSFTNSTMILGKNSDREPNEAQAIIRVPHSFHDDKNLQLTFRIIPQVKETYEVLLSKPFQMWGAEMGVNEFGLSIGNEAVFTKVKILKKNDGLTGMDMLRLALERKKTAESALFYITELLEEYGQDACGGYRDKNFFYHNSFLIADPKEAFVLETAGRDWVASRVKTFRTISNGLTIGEEYDYSSKNLIENTMKNLGLKNLKSFHFSKIYSDWFFTYFGKCKIRQAMSTEKGQELSKNFNIASAMKVLRTHGTEDQNFYPSASGMNSICVHAGGITAPSQTTGSMVAELREGVGQSTVWFTGTSAPCISLFKPFFFLGNTISLPDWKLPGEFPDDSLWWRGEEIHRRVLFNYPELTSYFLSERNGIEEKFLKKEKEFFLGQNVDLSGLDIFSKESLMFAIAKMKEWKEAISKPVKHRTFSLYAMYWNSQNSKVKFSLK